MRIDVDLLREKKRDSRGRIISRLSDDERALVVAAYQEGLPIKEISSRFGVSKGGINLMVKKAGVELRRPQRAPLGLTKPEYMRQYRLENPDRFRVAELKRYGLTLEDYQALLEAQKGVCAVCHQPETRKTKAGKVAPLHVDHDHQTGQVRSLLCHRCNMALGYVREDPEVARALVAYIESRCIS